jgi:hypothetical protein
MLLRSTHASVRLDNTPHNTTQHSAGNGNTYYLLHTQFGNIISAQQISALCGTHSKQLDLRTLIRGKHAAIVFNNDSCRASDVPAPDAQLKQIYASIGAHRQCTILLFNNTQLRIAIEVIRHLPNSMHNIATILATQDCKQNVFKLQHDFENLDKNLQGRLLEGSDPFEFDDLIKRGKLAFIEHLDRLDLFKNNAQSVILLSTDLLETSPIEHIKAFTARVEALKNSVQVISIEISLSEKIAEMFRSFKLAHYPMDLSLSIEEFAELLNETDAKHLLLPTELKNRIFPYLSENAKWKVDILDIGDVFDLYVHCTQDSSFALLESSKFQSASSNLGKSYGTPSLDLCTKISGTVSKMYDQHNPLLQYRISELHFEPSSEFCSGFQFPYSRFFQSLKSVIAFFFFFFFCMFNFGCRVDTFTLWK